MRGLIVNKLLPHDIGTPGLVKSLHVPKNIFQKWLKLRHQEATLSRTENRRNQDQFLCFYVLRMTLSPEEVSVTSSKCFGLLTILTLGALPIFCSFPLIFLFFSFLIREQ